MRDCKRLIKDFDREVKDLENRNDPGTNKMLNEKKQSMIKELNSYVALKKQYAANLDNKRIDLFDGGTEAYGEENVLLASFSYGDDPTAHSFLSARHGDDPPTQLYLICSEHALYEDASGDRIMLPSLWHGETGITAMTNQQLVDRGNTMMNETDHAIERSKKVVHETINVGTETASALKAQTEQMSRIVNELDSIHFSIKKASQLVKELGRQVATDRCIMALLFLIVVGVIAVIIVKKIPVSWPLGSVYTPMGKEVCTAMFSLQHVPTASLVHPNNKDIRDIPGLAPPAMNRKLLWNAN
ncbi:putative plant SNARE 12 [Morella rubra]|uniref:Putative plant SNARE 12 n=1 Tax=Morella rubra TaxID=262757 RepID=A0A6A1WJQ3_9ROSI|nr:putative plant SNARE 12 [Morella rubra]